jgi:hypothetical protein
MQGVLLIVNRIDQETGKEARAHKGCRTIQEEEEDVPECSASSPWLLP